MAAPATCKAMLAAALPLLAALLLTGCSEDNGNLVVSGDGDGDGNLRGSTTDAPPTNKSGFSLSSPDPRALVWDSVTEVDNVTHMHGWLRVPLDHDSAKPDGATPHVCLRVSVHARSAEPELGPLLMHCGGPGTGRDCPLITRAPTTIEGDFAFFGIDQRGVALTPDQPQPVSPEASGPPSPSPSQSPSPSPDPPTETTVDLPAACPFVEQSGEAVPPFPPMRCDSIYERLAGLSYDDQAAELRRELSDFLGGDSPTPSDEDVDVIFAILHSGGLPTDGVNGVAYLDETYVRWYYRLVSLENNLCVVSPRFQRTSPSGRAFNVLEFAGTADLARDIELFRRAIGADKMSLSGYSYGTMVAPTYATLFPERLGRMVLDGVLFPESNLLEFLTPYNMGFFSVFQGIMTDCSSSLYRSVSEDHECPLAPGPSSKVLQMINDETNLTRAAAVANLFINSLVNIAVAPLAVDYAARAYAGEAAPEWCAQLPQLCTTTAPTHGEPVGPSPSGDRFAGVTMIAGVWGSDMAGRLGEEGFISWWRGSMDDSPLGTLRGTLTGAAMASWPLYPRPLPPFGKSGIRALIVGNLHDAQTDYVGAQRMRAAYPDAALMTWQGYGHTLPANANVPFTSNATFQQNEIALQTCRTQVFDYLSSGLLPRDGHVCPLEEPLALGRSAVDNLLSSAR